MGCSEDGTGRESESYHALFRHRRLHFATDHLRQRRAVLRGPEAPLGFRSAHLGDGDPRRLPPGLVHVHVQSVALSGRALVGPERKR